MRDLDDSRLSFSITLEANTQPDDDVQQVDGLTIAVDRRSAPRMEGVTVDYTEADGFRFLHDGEGRSLPFLRFPHSINGEIQQVAEKPFRQTETFGWPARLAGVKNRLSQD